jgi:hypothetical protein
MPDTQLNIAAPGIPLQIDLIDGAGKPATSASLTVDRPGPLAKLGLKQDSRMERVECTSQPWKPESTGLEHQEAQEQSKCRFLLSPANPFLRI